nr:hypothetical protein CFP56_02464 [Quercus suber]
MIHRQFSTTSLAHYTQFPSTRETELKLAHAQNILLIQELKVLENQEVFRKRQKRNRSFKHPKFLLIANFSQKICENYEEAS